MKIVDVIEAVVLYALAIPVVVILVDALLAFAGGSQDNAVVVFFDTSADRLTPDVLLTMFDEQHDLQTLALVLLFYGIVALAVALVFRGVRGIVRSLAQRRQRRGQPGDDDTTDLYGRRTR